MEIIIPSCCRIYLFEALNEEMNVKNISIKIISSAVNERRIYLLQRTFSKISYLVTYIPRSKDYNNVKTTTTLL